MTNQGGSGEPQPWELRIDLGAPLARWQGALQRAIDLVSFGLTARETVPEGEVRLPGEVLRFAVASNYVMTFPEAKEEFGPWVLQSGFRDIVEGLHDFLEEARVACGAVSLGPKSTMPAGWIPPFQRESPRDSDFTGWASIRSWERSGTTRRSSLDRTCRRRSRESTGRGIAWRIEAASSESPTRTTQPAYASPGAKWRSSSRM
jgi:hypothetical protein